MVGGARSESAGTHHVVMIVSTRGNVCTGTALARDLVLTAAHCVTPGASYRIAGYGASYVIAVRSISLHPGFDARAYARNRATADVALVKLDSPLPSALVPAMIGDASETVVAGDALIVAGVGLTEAREETGIGIARSARLVATGQPGSLQIRLVDAATRNARAGLGACTGDSGGPAFRERNGRLVVIGIVSWSTGPGNSAGCGGLTGVTPLARYRDWIIETARKLGSALP
jgi:secreted trypsin-like serine protease